MRMPSIRVGPAEPEARLAYSSEDIPPRGGMSSEAAITISGILRRHWLMILLTFVVVTGSVWAVVVRLQPVYVASAHIKVQPTPTPNALSVAPISVQPQFDPAVVGTAIQVIRSPSIARQVMDDLQLDRLKEFTESTRIRQIIQQIKHVLGLSLDAAPGKENRSEVALRHLMSRVAVSSAQNSYVVTISAASLSPDLSAKIANAYATTYLAFQRKLKARASREANSLLSLSLTDLKHYAQSLESQAEKFREESGLTISSGALGQTVAGQLLAQLNSELGEATKARLAKEAEFDGMETLLKEGHPERAPAVLRSPVIQRLLEQESQASVRLTDMETRYGSKSRLLLAAPRAQLRQIQKEIAKETSKIAAGLGVEVKDARAREESLRKSMQRAQARVNQQQRASVRLKMLEAEAAANRHVYQEALARTLRTSSEANMEQPDAELISVAQPPLDPSYPRIGMTILLAAAGSTIFGAFLALTLERNRPGFRSAEEVEEATSLPVLGLIPKTSRFWRRRQGNQVEAPFLQAEDALNGTYFRLWNRNPHSGKVLMVTSSLPKEGKTFVGTALAFSLGRAGLRVLLIDCDLRRPSIAGIFRLRRSGLNAVFNPSGQGSASRDLAHLGPLSPGIATRISDKLDILPSFPGLPDPLKLLSSETMELLINRARLTYDVIIIDTPPILAVPDAGILSRFADATLLVTRWHKTHRVVVGEALRALQDYGAETAGVVLNMVDMRRYTFGRLGSHAYVHKSCRQYYGAGSYLSTRIARRHDEPMVGGG